MEVLVVKILLAIEGISPRAVTYRSAVFGSKLEGLNNVGGRGGFVVAVASVYFAAHQSYARIVVAITSSHATNANAVVISCCNGSSHVRSVSACDDHVGVALTAFGSVEVTSVYFLARLRVHSLPCRGSQVFVFEVDTRVHYGHNHMGVARLFLPSGEQVYVCPFLKHTIRGDGCGVMPLIFQVWVVEV